MTTINTVDASQSSMLGSLIGRIQDSVSALFALVQRVISAVWNCFTCSSSQTAPQTTVTPVTTSISAPQTAAPAATTATQTSMVRQVAAVTPLPGATTATTTTTAASTSINGPASSSALPTNTGTMTLSPSDVGSGNSAARSVPVNMVPVPPETSTNSRGSDEHQVGSGSSSPERRSSLTAQQLASTSAALNTALSAPPQDRSLPPHDPEELLGILSKNPQLPPGAQHSLTMDALRGQNLESLRGALKSVVTGATPGTQPFVMDDLFVDHDAPTTIMTGQSPVPASNNGVSVLDPNATGYAPAMTTPVIPTANSAGSPARSSAATSPPRTPTSSSTGSANNGQNTGSGNKKKKGRGRGSKQ